jgi:hypothetical protein
MDPPPPPIFLMFFSNSLAEKTRKNEGGKSREKNEIKTRHVRALFCELAQLYLLPQKKKKSVKKKRSVLSEFTSFPKFFFPVAP